MRLKAIQVINSSSRISSIDLFRAIAIISVVLYHFNNVLPYGYLGVDLFFVISGILVGGILVTQFSKEKKINYFKFILKRGGKIWPSYYFFIIVGNIIAFFLFNKSNPDQFIPLWDYKRYLLFYQNFTGTPFHWSFDHVWSLCVEEHFYIVLPIMFLIVQWFLKDKKFLFLFTILAIISGFIFKIIILKYTNSKDTYSATPNRIDALAWGVLISLLITFYKGKSQKFKYKTQLFFSGLILLGGLIYFNIISNNIFYNKVLFHSLVPISFSLMIFGTYFVNFREKTKPLAIIAYYSYNWYLWHPICAFFFLNSFNKSIYSFVLYLITSFSFAIITTIFVEEPCLRFRDTILKDKRLRNVNEKAF